MQTIVIDTETTGLPECYRMLANSNNLSNWNNCRIVQIAYRIYNESKELTASINQIIKPDGFMIPEASIEFHRITNERALGGISIKDALKLLMAYINNKKTVMVAHNMQFDKNVILSELYRNDMSADANKFCKINTVCTMLTNTPRGGRWPKLTKLYQSLFDDFDESKIHDAEYDTQMCASVYFGKRV